MDLVIKRSIECAVQASLLEEFLRRTWPDCEVSTTSYRPSCTHCRRVSQLLPFALRLLTVNAPKAIERKHFDYAQTCIQRARLMIQLNATTHPWKDLFPHGHKVEPAFAHQEIWKSR